MQGERLGSGVPRWVVAPIALALLGFLVFELRGVLTPIALALGIAYLLDPLVDRFEARRVPRGAAITIVLAILGAAFALFLLLVLPGMVREVVSFLGDLPAEIMDLVRRVEPWLAERGIPVPHDVREALEQFEIAPGELASHAAAPAQAILRFVLGGTASVIGALASALIVPVLAFYLLYDFDRMVVGARELVPPRIRPWVVEVATEIDAVLGQFVRGQLLVMLAMGVLYAAAYSLVGVRLAVPIGVVAGLLAFIPYVGGGSALGMGLLMCFVDWDGWWKPAMVVVAYLICQALEGFVIIPRVVGDKVGLPAVWVLVALMIGGELFGFLGVLLAVPAAAVVKIFVVRGLRWYKQSPMYVEGAGVERVAEVVRLTEAPAFGDDAPTASWIDVARSPAPEREPSTPPPPSSVGVIAAPAPFVVSRELEPASPDAPQREVPEPERQGSIEPSGGGADGVTPEPASPDTARTARDADVTPPEVAPTPRRAPRDPEEPSS